MSGERHVAVALATGERVLIAASRYTRHVLQCCSPRVLRLTCRHAIRFATHKTCLECVLHDDLSLYGSLTGTRSVALSVWACAIMLSSRALYRAPHASAVCLGTYMIPRVCYRPSHDTHRHELTINTMRSIILQTVKQTVRMCSTLSSIEDSSGAVLLH